MGDESVLRARAYEGMKAGDLPDHHTVWRRAAQYDPAGGPVLGWIMNQARSRPIDRLRYEQRKKRTAPPLADEASSGSGTDSAGEAVEAAFFLELSYPYRAGNSAAQRLPVKARIRSGLEKLRLALSVQEGRQP